MGKGKSIEDLKSEDFVKDRPIICINESHQIIDKLDLDNEVFGFQQDLNVFSNGCPRSGKMFLRSGLSHMYSNIDLYEYDFDFGGHPTICICLDILKTFNVKKVILVGFDALQYDSTERANLEIKKYRPGKVGIYLLQKNKVLESLKGIEYEYLKGKETYDSPASYTHELSDHSQLEHHGEF